MKAGNGIIQDETLNYDSKTDSKLTHGFQFIAAMGWGNKWMKWVIEICGNQAV
jgi:hypothetical protein